MTYKPTTFKEIVDDAAAAVSAALKAGDTRIEVEFPPVPTTVDGRTLQAAWVQLVNYSSRFSCCSSC
jgi:Domain of unknown function (DUF1995)